MENEDTTYRSNDAQENLTDWENEPTVMDLKQDLTDASSDHQGHVIDVDRWLDNLNIEGKAKVPKVRGRSSIVPKLIRKQAEWRYPALTEPFLSTEDIFNVAPVTFEDKEAAIQNELVLNHQFNNQLKKVKFIDEYVRAAVDEGTVVVRVGWDFEEEEQPVMVPDFAMMPIPAAMGAMPGMAPPPMQGPAIGMPPGPGGMGGVQFEKVQVGEHEEMQMVTTKNQPTLDICDYNNIMIDPTCEGDLDKANFIIFSFETSKSELKKDGKYTNIDQINVEANSILGMPDSTHNNSDSSYFNFSDEPRKKFIAYEYWGYWDIDNTGVVKPFVAAWVGDVMIRMESSPFPDQKLPFVKVQYLPVRKSNYGEPDGELLEDNQQVVGAVTRGMIDIMGRSANGQTGMRKDMLDVTNRRKFDRGQDYEFNSQVDPKQGVHMHVFPEIPRSAEYLVNQQNAEAEALTGVKAFSQGITGQALGNTATAVRSALDATSKRELGILRRLADGMVQIGEKIVSMNAEFLSDQEVIRITNEEFIEISAKDLAGKFDLKLSISTAEADNEKAQELSFMLQTMGNNMDPALSQVILSDIARLRKMPDLSKRIAEYQPQPDPFAEQMKALELRLKEAEVKKEEAAAMENMSTAELNQAKAQTEIARTRNLDSQSDLKDLDFVEQESGVNQVRDMEKLEKQAQDSVRQEAAKSVFSRAEDANNRSPAAGGGLNTLQSRSRQ